EAIVPAVQVRLVREPVELGADLSDFGDHDLLVAAAHVRELVHERAFDVHVETSSAEKRHLVVEHVAELDHLSGLDQLDRIEHALRLHVIARAALVVRSPFRWAALALGRRRPAWRLRQGDASRHEYGCRCGAKCDPLHRNPPATLFRTRSGSHSMRRAEMSRKPAPEWSGAGRPSGKRLATRPYPTPLHTLTSPSRLGAARLAKKATSK